MHHKKGWFLRKYGTSEVGADQEHACILIQSKARQFLVSSIASRPGTKRKVAAVPGAGNHDVVVCNTTSDDAAAAPDSPKLSTLYPIGPVLIVVLLLALLFYCFPFYFMRCCN